MYGRISKRGFTLIELLVVIAIIAILAIVVVVTLNPAELLRQSRDANRLSDLATLNSAISLYQTDQNGVSGFSLGNASSVYLSLPDASSTCNNLGLPTSSGNFNYACSTATSSRNINSSGWIPINLSLISSGSPLSSLPVDPTNQSSSGLYYSYATNGQTFEVSSLFESAKNKTQFGQKPITPSYPELNVVGNPNINPLFNPSGLVGYWPMDEGSGSSTFDASGNGMLGAIYSNSFPWAIGKVGPGAYSGDGAGNLAVLTNSGGLKYQGGNLSVLFWVNPNPSDDGGYIVSKPWNGSGGYNWYAISSGGQNVSVTVALTGATFYSYVPPPTIAAGIWHQVAMIFSSSQSVMVYFDGVVAGTSTNTVSNWTPANGDNNSSIAIACIYPYLSTSNYCSTNPSTSFKGFVDDVRVYNRALSTAEIQALYNAEK